jgi:hypothetical protein
VYVRRDSKQKAGSKPKGNGRLPKSQTYLSIAHNVREEGPDGSMRTKLLTGEKKRGILGASRALPVRGALRSWPPFGWRSGRPRPRPRSGTDVASPAVA